MIQMQIITDTGFIRTVPAVSSIITKDLITATGQCHITGQKGIQTMGMFKMKSPSEQTFPLTYSIMPQSPSLPEDTIQNSQDNQSFLAADMAVLDTVSRLTIEMQLSPETLKMAQHIPAAITMSSSTLLSLRTEAQIQKTAVLETLMNGMF